MDEELEIETASEPVETSEPSEPVIIDNSESFEEVKGQLETTSEQLEEIRATMSTVESSVSQEADYSEITNKLDDLQNAITETIVQSQNANVTFYNDITDIGLFAVAVVLGALAIKTFFLGGTKW